MRIIVYTEAHREVTFFKNYPTLCIPDVSFSFENLSETLVKKKKNKHTRPYTSINIVCWISYVFVVIAITP